MKTLRLLGIALTLAIAAFAQDISGTYSGPAKLEMPDGGQREVNFTIVLKKDGEKLAVSAAPTTEGQIAADKVERAGSSIKFEVTPPGDTAEPVKFDVKVDGGKIIGKMSTIKRGQTVSGTVELVRQ